MRGATSYEPVTTAVALSSSAGTGALSENYTRQFGAARRRAGASETGVGYRFLLTAAIALE
jgi:hypothetical protein